MKDKMFLHFLLLLLFCFLNVQRTSLNFFFRMKGCKTRKRKPRKASKEDVITNNVSSPAAVGSVVGPSDDRSTSLEKTPKRAKRQRGQIKIVALTSTPVHGSCTDVLSNIPHLSPQISDMQLEYKEITTNPKTPEANSPCSNSKSQRRKRRGRSKTRQVAQKVPKEQTEVSAPKRRRGRPRKSEDVNLKGEAAVQSVKRSRPRFELLDSSEQEDESLLSSDLSIELSHYEEQLPRLTIQEDEKSDDDEEEELPSFLMQTDKKPSLITKGAFVWCKFRNYPYWPAWVKSVNRKRKKASIVFVDQAFAGVQRKGFALALKSMKPFDCEEADELVHTAKETYDAAVKWSLELIEDYRIRIACGSFSGSFIEYFNHDMSYPVRRTYPQTASERLTIASDTTIEDLCDDHECCIIEKKDICTSTKRLLPDRTHAAHNRANEKLVRFIVKQRMVEPHLLAVIRGQEQSRWLRAFLSAKRRRVVNPYLEDDEQLDQVYRYLNELYTTTVATSPCLAEVKQMEQVPFVLDVLLPEAIIYAIAGVDNVSVKKAEEKYLKGRCISNRERQEFDLMIEQQMKRKQCQNTALELYSNPII